MNDLVATLADLPPRHSGVLFERLHQAALSAVFYMRAMGLALPGKAQVPSYAEVYDHLSRLTNHALNSYCIAQAAAPENQKANEIWGEEEDCLFSIAVTGISGESGDGYMVSVDFNLLYGR